LGTTNKHTIIQYHTYAPPILDTLPVVPAKGTTAAGRSTLWHKSAMIGAVEVADEVLRT